MKLLVSVEEQLRVHLHFVSFPEAIVNNVNPALYQKYLRSQKITLQTIYYP